MRSKRACPRQEERGETAPPCPAGVPSRLRDGPRTDQGHAVGSNSLRIAAYEVPNRSFTPIWANSTWNTRFSTIPIATDAASSSTPVFLVVLRQICYDY